jgi:hypothetical protein
MAIKIKVDPIDRDVGLIIDELLTPEARRKQLADMARQYLDEADEANRRALGKTPMSKTFVDGREGAPLESVRADGVIVREYDLVLGVLAFIMAELRAISPVRSGRYQKSHTLFADGVEVPPNAPIPEAKDYVFLSDVEYARKIEGQAGRKPQSPMAPKGVYEITAAKADRQYSNVAKIWFVWRSPILAYGGAPSRHRKKAKTWTGGKEWQTRVPAILVRLGK